MSHKMLFKSVVLPMMFISLLVGCSAPTEAPEPTPTSTLVPSTVPSTPTAIPPTDTPTPIPPTATPIPTNTPTPEPSPTPMLNPITQGYHHMAYDSESDVVVLVPREEKPNKNISNQTWLFDLNTRTWEQMSGGPPGGEGPMAYDAQSDRTILFLGSSNSLTPRSQTWAYDANTDTWTEMAPEESPSGWLGARMVYDSESDRMILVTGCRVTGEGYLLTNGVQPETWAYDYETNTWTNMQPTGELTPVDCYFAMSYDAGAGRVITWISAHSYPPTYKIGIYDYNSNTWEQRVMEEPYPSSIYYSTMVYDPNSGLNILFGGVNASESPYNETWGYDYGSNSWKKLASGLPPKARGWHAMVYHEAENVFILFGGGPSRDEFTNETWVYDPATGQWSDYTIMP